MFKNIFSKLKDTLKKSPLTMFFVLLILLFAVIATGSTLRAPQESGDDTVDVPKQVSLFDPNETPRMDMAAKVDKKNVITLTAQVSGIVSHIHVLDGKSVYAGQPIISLADTYNGKRLSDIDQSITAVTDTLTGEISEREESIAEEQLEDSPRNSSTETVILRKQLAIEKRAADLNAEVAQLQNQRAQVSGLLYTPAAPAKGILERVYVSPGDYVTPGTILATISLDAADTVLEMLIPLNIISVLDVAKPSILTLGTQTVDLYPISLSREATRGQNYSVLYAIPSADAQYLANNSFTSLSIPLSSNGNGLLVPIDAVTVARDASYAFIEKDGVAHATIVTVGNVYGEYVEIREGLTRDDKLILDRNILDGDQIEIIE